MDFLFKVANHVDSGLDTNSYQNFQPLVKSQMPGESMHTLNSRIKHLKYT